MSIEWKVEKRKLAELKCYEKNPRKITEEAFEKLKSRITKRGFHDILKILPDGTILSGNQRKRALTELGYEEVDVKVPDRELTQAEIDSVVLESNRSDGVFDWDMMGNNYDVDFLLDIGFDKNELGIDFSKEETDDDAFVDNIVGEPQAKVGDVYKLGNHRIICGDSTDPAVIDKLMGGGASRDGVYRSALQRGLWRWYAR